MNTFVSLWIVSFCLFVVSFKSKRLATLCSVPFVFFCFLLAAFRADKFPDYNEYANIFQDVSVSKLMSASFFSIHGELGFKLICKFLSVFFDSSLSLMILFSFLSFFLLMRICYSNGLSLPAVWLVYFSNSFLLKDLAQVRNAVASLLVVEGVLFLGRRGHRLEANLRFIVAGFFFQYLALSAMLIPLFKNNFLLTVSFFLSVILFFVLDFEWLRINIGDFGYLSQYSGTNYVDAEYYNKWPAIVRVLLFIVAVSWFSKDMNDPAVGVLKLAVLISFFCYVAFSGIPILSQRLGGYFFSVDAFLCAVLLQRLKSLYIAIFIAIYAILIFSFNFLSREFLSGGYESIY